MRRELLCHVDWYNEHRPHDHLGGQPPDEVYHDLIRRIWHPRMARVFSRTEVVVL